MTTPTVTAATPNLNAAGCWYSIPVTFPLTGTSAAFVAIDRPPSLRYQAPRPRRPNLGPWRRDYRSEFQESSDTLRSPGGLRDGLLQLLRGDLLELLLPGLHAEHQQGGDGQDQRDRAVQGRQGDARERDLGHHDGQDQHTAELAGPRRQPGPPGSDPRRVRLRPLG